MKLSKNIILITGGATGIGLGLTERFIQEDNTVIICGRRESALRAVKTRFPEVITRVCDLAVEAERRALFDWISATHHELSVLINNAGIQHYTDITDPDFFQLAKQELLINIEAPLHLTTLFLTLKSLTTVVNVTSGLAFTPYTKVPVYSATKAFLRSFTLSLRHLLQAKNIEVIEIIPPAINTELGGKGLHDSMPPVSDFILKIFDQLKEGKTELTYGTSEARSKAGAEELKSYFNKMNQGS